jgi:hypothetical protein
MGYWPSIELVTLTNKDGTTCTALRWQVLGWRKRIFDVQGARTAGYSDKEIADELVRARVIDFGGAREPA